LKGCFYFARVAFYPNVNEVFFSFQDEKGRRKKGVEGGGKGQRRDC
jgi:hypothetical protein